MATIGEPIALAFTPDGRLLIASQLGQLRVYKNGALLQAPALNISSKICTNSERGLLGVAVDPNFSTNRYVYLFYTHNKAGVCPTGQPTSPSNPVNRVSRFVMSGDGIDPASERILIDNIPSPGYHQAGDLRFGKDGYLYVSVGDGGCDYAGNSGCAGANDASRDTNILLGKILRITRDGGIPATNPYTGIWSARCNLTGRTDPGKNCQETFARGLRNPFRFAFDPDTSSTRFLVNDVGQNAWEEVDEGKSGADYGWNLCEGNHDNPDRDGSVNCAGAPYTSPTHEYGHTDTGCSSITGGAFVPNGAWPTSYDNSYLFGDYVCNKIFELTPKDGGGFTSTEFASELGPAGPIAMAFGPHGSGKALYYTTYANGGEVHRIAYTGANRTPNAAVSASPSYGDVPLNVAFDGSGSGDPDIGDTLTYVWDFGDGSPTVETQTSTTNHTYGQAGTYTATLTVRDSDGAQDTTTVRIDAGNEPPEPIIESPAASKLFKVGEELVLQGSATDPQDGPLADSALSWEVLQYHNTHTHPFLPLTPGNNVKIAAPAPEDLAATETSYLEIRLTATDSKGLTKTITQELHPKLVDVTFQSQPTGAQLQVNGTTFTASRTFVSWEGYKLTVYAPSSRTLAGTTYAFGAWSDGKGQRHDILTGAEASTYTATYKACTITGTSGNDVLEGTSGSDVICGLGGNDTLNGFGGDDTLKGGDGADTLLGGSGNDALDGGLGTDAASYSGSAAAITASLIANTATGEGADTLAGVENLTGSSKDDVLTGSSGANTLWGSGGTDNLSGSGGNDMLWGGLGNDSLVGGSGADELFGEDGNDSLNSKDGVSGNDSLDGGAGTDTKVTDATEASIIGFP